MARRVFTFFPMGQEIIVEIFRVKLRANWRQCVYGDDFAVADGEDGINPEEKRPIPEALGRVTTDWRFDMTGPQPNTLGHSFRQEKEKLDSDYRRNKGANAL